jgi:hypothetical protein
MVLNLSSFSSLSGSSALIRPISITNQLISLRLFARHALDVFPISKLPYTFNCYFRLLLFCHCLHPPTICLFT